MRNRVLILIVLTLTMILAAGCRSRRNVPAPQPAPPQSAPVVEAAPVEPVTSPDDDFPDPGPDAEVLSADITDANRQARERGYIRDAFFSFDEATLDTDAQEALRASATWLRANPAFTLRIEGHCDSRGTEQYNFALGERRASTAATYLGTLGVGSERVSTVSYGETRPFEEGESEASWAQNRRAHLVLSGRR